MHTPSKITRALTAALLVIGAAGAKAQEPSGAEAWATMGNFQIQVIDLDLNDGVTAGVTFDDNTQAFGTTAYTQMSPDGITSRGDPGPLFTARSSAGELGFNRASSSTTAGDPFLPGMGTGATARAKAVGAGSSVVAGGVLFQGYFSLTANTRLIFSADAGAVGASVSRPDELASAFAQVLVGSLNGEVFESESSYAAVLNGVFESNGATRITASFDNLSGAAVGGQAMASVFALSRGHEVPLIPEPETYLLALIGSLAISVEVRRQRRRPGESDTPA
jgi:hypothetical protein